MRLVVDLGLTMFDPSGISDKLTPEGGKTLETKLKDRLRGEHSRRFIGRQDELAQVQAALESGKAVVLLHGVAGVGKTTLLKEFEARSGLQTVRIDGRDVVATPDGFQYAYSAMTAALEPGPSILQIDNYETLDSLDRWFRDAFIPELPENRFVLIAGRRSPSAGWTARSPSLAPRAPASGRRRARSARASRSGPDPHAAAPIRPGFTAQR